MAAAGGRETARCAARDSRVARLIRRCAMTTGTPEQLMRIDGEDPEFVLIMASGV